MAAEQLQIVGLKARRSILRTTIDYRTLIVVRRHSQDMLQQHLSDKVDHWAALRYLAEASKYAEGAVLAETFAAIVAPYFHQVMKHP